MVLSVYGDSVSGNCLKVKWVLDRLKIDYRWVETSVIDGRTRTPEFLGINPAGQVPAVRLEDGRSLAQSNAIIGYFAEGTDLVPDDRYERARMYEWMFWEQYSHEPYIAVRRFQMFYLGRPDAELDPKLFERGAAALGRMEFGLEGRDRLSLADVALVAYTRVAHQGGFDLGLYPRVKAWVARVEGELGLPPAA